MNAPPPRLELRGVRKRFGATVALDGVDLAAGAGEVHAVLGENGAGKSTLMRILAGVVAPDAGDMRLDGTPFRPVDPRAARAAGIAMVHQEPSGCPHLSVAANVVLGTEPARRGIVRAPDVHRAAREALAFLGGAAARLPVGAPLSALSPAEQQLVEIARALRQAAGGRVLVLDEPTSALGRPEVETLFEVIARLAGQGMTILYISHLLDEVERVAARFTVLRDGRAVATGVMARGGGALDEIVRAMTGRPVAEQFLRAAHVPGAALLPLDGFGRSGTTALELRAGEVLGIAGLVGSGRTTLLRAIFQATPGAGMLSEDRAGEGLAQGRSVAENLTLSRIPTRGLGIISARRERLAFLRWTRRLAVRCRGPTQRVRELSGGNQQKVALGRLLHQRARVLLLDEPTRGVDIASKTEIHRLVDELARAGKAILLVSSDFRELLGVCDRIAVMHRGRLGEARPASSWSEPALLLAAGGAAPAAGDAA